MLQGRPPAETSRDLLVWRKAHEYVLSMEEVSKLLNADAATILSSDS